jgi:hypothetical protein
MLAQSMQRNEQVIEIYSIFLWHSQSLLRYFLVYGNCTLLKRTIPGKTKLM